ncbi:hypothetical protein [Celerinatantimonas sp. MCCC 1A17872]|uniref:hypothetical protein n=1 Tax=Celerinatantimonas sp. MCCC 1A17872 TaxID=3177514 RepID=UPI0038C74F9D
MKSLLIIVAIVGSVFLGWNLAQLHPDWGYYNQGSPVGWPILPILSTIVVAVLFAVLLFIGLGLVLLLGGIGLVCLSAFILPAWVPLLLLIVLIYALIHRRDSRVP